MPIKTNMDTQNEGFYLKPEIQLEKQISLVSILNFGG